MICSMSFLESMNFRKFLIVFGKFLMGAGGFSFFFGGRALHEFAHVDRILDEVEGIAAAVALILLGAALKNIGESEE